MGWATELQPRHPVVAARLCLGFICTAAVVQLVQTATTPLDGGPVGLTLSYGIPAALILAGLVLLLRARRVPSVVWGIVPTVGLAAIVALDVTSHDASVLAQVFLFFPVLFAASQLPRRAGIAVTALAALGELVATFGSEPVDVAAFESAVVVSAMITAAALLQHSNREQDRLVESLDRLARFDALTGLVARRPFDEETGAALRAATTPGHPGTAMMLVDLDLFKQVNDVHGHPVGDDLLVHAARFLDERCRRSDLVGRLGGDEFAVLLPECPYEDALARAARLVRDAARCPLVLASGEEVRLSFTIGVGHVGAQTCPRERELYSGADAALYRAKRAGRGGFA